jgi:hypothetical protein
MRVWLPRTDEADDKRSRRSGKGRKDEAAGDASEADGAAGEDPDEGLSDGTL